MPGISRLLNPWCRVLEKLAGFQLVKNVPAFYGTRRFITPFTTARHLSLSWASSIQSIPPHTISWRSILILSSHLRLRLQSGLFPSGSSSSCSWRVRRVSCSLVLKMKLVPPSLSRSSHVFLSGFPHQNPI